MSTRNMTRGAAEILAVADRAGLPQPYNVAITEAQVAFSLRTSEQVTEWAYFLDTEATTAVDDLAGTWVHSWTEGVLYDLPVRVSSAELIDGPLLAAIRKLSA